MAEYILTEEYLGYISKPELTNTKSGYLAPGSINVIIDWSGIIGTRAGFVRLGRVASGSNGVDDAFDWDTSKGFYHLLRKYDGVVEFLYNDEWYPIISGLTNSKIAGFTTVYDNTNKVTKCIFIVGDTNIYEWTGGFATVASNTANTITMQQAGTWGGRGFLTTGSVRINGVDYAYTGGTATQTITGLSGLPALPVGTMVTMKVGSTPNPVQFPVGQINEHIGIFRNQLYFGSSASRVVLVSKASNYLDFSSSTPRAVGDGNSVTIDDVCMGFIASENSMTIFGKNDDIYNIKYDIVTTNTVPYEVFAINKLKTARRQGLLTRSAKTTIKNAIAYITREPTLDTVGSIENVNSTQNVPISDIIKNDFDSYDFTDAYLKYWKRNIVISIPKHNLILLYDLQRGLWQPPQSFGFPIGVLSIGADGGLIGHHYLKDESYKLFTGLNDNGVAIFQHTALFVLNNFGTRYEKKQLSKYVQDGYISANATLKRKLIYDYRGQAGESEKEISGANPRTTYYRETNAGFGQAHIGERPLSGSQLTPPDDIRRFRVIHSEYPVQFYELQVKYEMKDVLNGVWKLVVHGSDAALSDIEPNEITE